MFFNDTGLAMYIKAQCKQEWEKKRECVTGWSWASLEHTGHSWTLLLNYWSMVERTKQKHSLAYRLSFCRFCCLSLLRSLNVLLLLLSLSFLSLPSFSFCLFLSPAVMCEASSPSDPSASMQKFSCTQKKKASKFSSIIQHPSAMMNYWGKSMFPYMAV